MPCATPQFHNAWISVSGSVLHASHRLSAIIRFLDKFTWVGRMHLQARQPKTFILFGNLSFHKLFHTSLPTAPLEHSAQFNSLHAFYASRYPDLTEYTPDFSPLHTTVSGISLKLNGTCNMASASSWWKLCRISSQSHPLDSKSINSATVISSSMLGVGWSTLFVL